MPKEKPVFIDPGLVEKWIMEFGAFGAHSGTGVWRTVYSPEWVAATDAFENWGRDAGLAMRRDAVGNVWARLEGKEDGSAVVSGSHIDTQRPGGRYDGAAGALAALIAIKALKEQFGTPRLPLEAVALCEEEGSRFPSAGFWGSRAIVGRIAPGDPDKVVGYDGETIAEAMRAVGLHPEHAQDARRADIAAFIELHIEQGPILEDAGLPVAIVDAITGIRHVEVTLTGEQNHAGAFPMDRRRDPMAGFAEIVSTLIDHAHRIGRPAVTTIGRVHVDPNGAAVVPRSVTFTIDARHPDPEARKTLYAVHDAVLREVSERRRLALDVRPVLSHDPCLSDPHLLEVLKSAAAEQAIPHLIMASGAGHDSQQMAVVAPVAMIFVRSKEGRSHTPEEFSSVEDLVEGTRLLAEALYKLAY
ncbi:MAG: hydantoinase/carbamoylase family amidase [Rhizobiaceae bacterium]